MTNSGCGAGAPQHGPRPLTRNEALMVCMNLVSSSEVVVEALGLDDNDKRKLVAALTQFSACVAIAAGEDPGELMGLCTLLLIRAWNGGAAPGVVFSKPYKDDVKAPSCACAVVPPDTSCN